MGGQGLELRMGQAATVNSSICRTAKTGRQASRDWTLQSDRSANTLPDDMHSRPVSLRW